ncbi:MAG TPA: PRC-barrel domain-containing protein [Planctomycetota bacterium]|jgi:sporulation protein YlmC with PRC-barrel domain|nr:PRC-barrel domain-containing protein [Planctomycetota bacterium]
MGAQTKLMQAGLLSGNRLSGCRVENSAGEVLGKVEDIILDEEQGRVAYLLLSLGGFLGIGTKFFVFPWAAVHHDRGERKVIVDIDRESLRNAPGFDRETWPDLSDRTWASRIRRSAHGRP